jgi:hypothetical protein
VAIGNLSELMLGSIEAGADAIFSS